MNSKTILDSAELIHRLTALGIIRDIPGLSECAPPSMPLDLENLSPQEQQEILAFLKKLEAIRMPLALTKELLPSLAREMRLKNLSFSQIIEALALRLTRSNQEIYELLNLDQQEVAGLQRLWSSQKPDEAALKKGGLTLKKLANSFRLDEGGIRGIIRNSLKTTCGGKGCMVDKIMEYFPKS